jgi:Flp pilus assembly protein TadB
LLVLRIGLAGRRLTFERAPAGVALLGVRRLGMSLGTGLVVYLLTGWLIASTGCALLILAVSIGAAKSASTRRDERIAEAIALWSEQLRDTLAAAHGLQQTIVATAPHAPTMIRQAVARLAAALPYGSVSQSLRQFALEVDHSSAATEHEARDVASLLGHLAQCARDEAQMHQRVWVGRARTRTAVKIIMGTVIGFVAALMLLNRDYLDPYSTPSGQLTLVGIFAVFAVALIMLQRGSRILLPDRFISGGAS